ncbi:hypothetical protein GCM10027343_22180 [Noviherbaspirillum agri]
MKQKHIFLAAVLLLVLLFVAGTVAYNKQRADQAAQTVVQNQESLVRFHSPSLGNANAKAHIVEFFDPACETCRDFYPFVKDMMAANPGQIRLSVRYAPFHEGSDQVVRLLEAARKQGKFWEALETLYAAQPEWVQHHTARLELVWKHMEDLGLDMERLRSDMNSPEITRIIEQDIADAKKLNVTKTPEFFVNGKPMPSFGYEQLQGLVKDALSGA